MRQWFSSSDDVDELIICVLLLETGDCVLSQFLDGVFPELLLAAMMLDALFDAAEVGVNIHARRVIVGSHGFAVEKAVSQDLRGWAGATQAVQLEAKLV